jgi:NADH dehydrogenase
MNHNGTHRVVIIGGGFGGLYAAQALGKSSLPATLIDRRNFHLFQPLLYQVATGGLSPANIAAPLRGVLARKKNIKVLLGEVVDFDIAGRQVVLADGDRVSYDALVVAAGAVNFYFRHPEWEELAPGLKSIEDATEIRRRVLMAFEEAERHPSEQQRQALLTFVVVGGGPTGVELAGALADVARVTLRNNFRSIDPASARILLVEGADRILGAFPAKLSTKAVAALTRLGVQVRTNTLVEDIQPGRVTLRRGEHKEELPAHTVLWGAGVKPSPVAERLAASTGASMDRTGRIIVQPDLSVPGHPEVFVIGDMAHFAHQDRQPLPGLAPVAMQQGRYVASVIQRRLQGQAVSPFRYTDRGTMATIGRAAAVAHVGFLRFNGMLAWLAWLFIHILFLIRFENRLLVLTQWAWNYFTRNRSARLITGHGVTIGYLANRPCPPAETPAVAQDREKVTSER